MMLPMRTVDPSQELQDGFDPAAVPPLASEGGLELPPVPAARPERPSLCHVGPCRRYHRLEIQMDHQQGSPLQLPLGLELPAGTRGVTRDSLGARYAAPPTFHVQVSHYCYPDTGIEMPLGAMPVVKCNRWEPRNPGWMDTPEGRQWARDLATWERERAADEASDREAQRVLVRFYEPKIEP